MKKTLFFALVFLLTAGALIAEDNTSVGFYMGSKPLGVEIKSSDAFEGPYGSILVSSPGVGKKGNKSIGTGFSYILQDNAKICQVPISISYTFVDNLDFSLAIPILRMTGVKDGQLGFSDIFATAKYGFDLDEIKTAFSFGIAFPSGAERFTGNKNNVDLNFDLPIEKEFENCIANIDFGYSVTDINETTKKHIVKAAGALSRSLNKKVGGSLEMMYQDTKKYSSLIAGIGLKYNAKAGSYTIALAKDLHKRGVDFLFSLGFSKSF